MKACRNAEVLSKLVTPYCANSSIDSTRVIAKQVKFRLGTANHRLRRDIKDVIGLERHHAAKAMRSYPMS